MEIENHLIQNTKQKAQDSQTLYPAIPTKLQFRNFPKILHKKITSNAKSTQRTRLWFKLKKDYGISIKDLDIKVAYKTRHKFLILVPEKSSFFYIENDVLISELNFSFGKKIFFLTFFFR